MYLSNVLPWNSAQWIAPPPEEIARIRKEAGTHDAALAEEGGDIQAARSRSRGEIEPEQKDSLESGDTETEKRQEHREGQ